MKIYIKAEDHRFSISIPTGFLFRRPMVKLWLWGMRRSQEYVDIPEQAENALWNLPEESVLRLCEELRRIKKRHGKWKLVEVEASSGEQVLIEL